MRLRSLVILIAVMSAALATPASGRAAERCGVRAMLPASSTPPPVSSNCPGIRPGALMTSPAGCTMNFVFRNGPSGGDRYIGTAGHCVGGIGQRVSLSGVGAMGTVVYVGRDDPDYDYRLLDFALVKVDAARVSQVNPAMCHWGGPTSMVAPPPLFAHAVPVVHYGHGIVTGTFKETKARRGLAFWWGSLNFWFLGAVAFGDSGSAVMTMDGAAAGVAVEITAFDNKATRIDVSIDRASRYLGVPLTLMTAPLA